jgi:hypothetical protein
VVTLTPARYVVLHKVDALAESAAFILFLGARPLRYDERLGQYAFLSP